VRIALGIRKLALSFNLSFYFTKNIPEANPSFFCDTNFPRPKKKKYPDGYPGDQPSATSTDPIKYACHRCNKTYPPVPHPNSPEGQALGDTIEPLECTRCGHPRCAECRRAQPQKVEPQPDPEVVKSVEAKLAALRLSSTTET
jgi:DNA-directed RNA polymerase subunit RPC12/RpoP